MVNDSLTEIMEHDYELRDGIPTKYIVAAFKKIEIGDIMVEDNPTGLTSLKEVYVVASKLYDEAQAKRRNLFRSQC